MASETQRAWSNTGREWNPPHFNQPKLTPRQRDDIRRRVADGESVMDLATEYGVSTRTIRLNS